MKRSEMLEILLDAVIDNTELEMTTDEASMILQRLEEAGMLPPNNCYSGDCAKFNGVCGNEWGPEDEKK